MIKSFRITNNIGESITLDIRRPEDTGFLVTSVTGITPPKADISTSDIAMFDGNVLANRRVEERNIVLSIVFYDSNNDKSTIEELRHKCYRYFPVKEQVTFYTINDSGTYSIKGYIESNEINIFSQMEAAQISIICPDPYFTKSNSDQSAYVSQIQPNFQFPVSFEYVGKDIPGYTKWTDPWVVIPTRSVQTLQTKKRYFYGNIVVTKVLTERIGINEANGYTAYIRGDEMPDTEQVIEENPNLIFDKYDDKTNFTPEAQDVIIPVSGLYTEDNITVDKISYTDSDSYGMTTRTFSKVPNSPFNPFKYTDYTGSYIIAPGTTEKTFKSANRYLLGNVIVCGSSSSRVTNGSGGDTLTISIDRNVSTDTLQYIDSTTVTKFTGPFTLSPDIGAAMTLQTKGKYADSDITVKPLARFIEHDPSDKIVNYVVYIGE